MWGTAAGSAFSLWLAFAAVHLWLGYLNLFGPGFPLGDVTSAYPFWVERGLLGDQWMGIDTAWVYPFLALVPMLVSYASGPELYGATWLTMVMTLNAVALFSIIGGQERARHPRVAWWWMLFLVLVGPIALGRIDAITVPLAIVAVMIMTRYPRLAGALLAVGTFLKVWPAGLVLAAFIALRARACVLIGAGAASVMTVALGLALGGGAALLSPLTEQTGRGLQVEAPVSTVWLWWAAVEQTNAGVYYDTAILTWQVFGAGTTFVAALLTPVLALLIVAITVLGLLAVRRGVDEVRLLPVVGLALVMALIVANKVGSPQFATWIAVPIILGLAWQAHGGLSFRVPAILALTIAALTQLVYPVLYGSLLALDPRMLGVLTVRNTLYLVLLGWAIWRLTVLIKEVHDDRGFFGGTLGRLGTAV